MYECDDILESLIALYCYFAACFAFSLACFAAVGIKLSKRQALGSKFLFIQLQVSVSIFFSELFVVLGFALSPCEPLSGFASPNAFASFCVAVGALQCFFTLATFTWIALLNVNLAHVVAKECHDEILRRVQRKQDQRRLSLEDRAMKGRRSTISSEGPKRKISRDLLEVWKKNVEEIHEKELAEAAEQEEKANESIEAVKKFSRLRTPIWLLLSIGYAIPAVISGLSFASRPEVEMPEEGSLFHWDNVVGLDLFCWPGIETNVVWFIAPYVLCSLILIYFARVRCSQMMRNTYLKEEDADVRDAWTRSDSIVAQIGAHRLEQTSIQILVVIYSAVLGFLQVFYFWGEMRKNRHELNKQKISFQAF